MFNFSKIEAKMRFTLHFFPLSSKMNFLSSASEPARQRNILKKDLVKVFEHHSVRKKFKQNRGMLSG